MNVNAYASVVVALGLVISYLIGRTKDMGGPIGSIILFIVLSIGVGLGLAYPLLVAVGHVCAALGISGSSCLDTNDQTVWYWHFRSWPVPSTLL
jgi:hypothetical protein